MLPTAPDLRSARPKRKWRIGELQAMLYERPPSMVRMPGLPCFIGYIWAMAVYGGKSGKELLTIVTAEVTLGIPGEIEEPGETASPFLCEFLPDGTHINRGNSPEWSDEEQFVAAALDTAKALAADGSEPVEVSANRWPWVVPIVLLVTVMIAALTQPALFQPLGDFTLTTWLALFAAAYFLGGIVVLTLTPAAGMVAAEVAAIRKDASRSPKPIPAWKLWIAVAILWAGAFLFWIVFVRSWLSDDSNA